MFVLLMPAINFEISDHLYYLNPNHGRWLVPTKSSVTRGQEIFEVEYEESKRDEFLSSLKKRRKIKFVFRSPADGSIDLERFYQSTDPYRNYGAAPKIDDRESLSKFGTSFRLTMTSNMAVSPQEFYGDWFKALFREEEWITSNMRQQSGYTDYHDKWIELMRRENSYLNGFVCPVLEETEFQNFQQRK